MPGPSGHRDTTSRRRARGGVRGRVAAAAAATMLAAGGAVAVAPSANAQEGSLPPPVQSSYEAQHRYVQQALGSAVVGAYAAVALPYLMWVCPVLGDLGLVEPTSCQF